jgi:hypothetical protein
MDYPPLAESAEPRDVASTAEQGRCDNTLGKASLDDYESTIGYIADLIGQLKGSHERPETCPQEEAVGLLPGQPAASGQAPTESPDQQDASHDNRWHVSQTGGKASRLRDQPNVISDLREAAFLATSTALQLSDCSRFARRSYYAVCSATAASLFSVVFLAMSPRLGSLGFAVGVATLLLAVVLAIVYLLSLRAARQKMARLRRTVP